MIIAASIDGTSVLNRAEFTLTDMSATLFSRPSPRDNEQTRPDADGSFELTQWYNSRAFTLTGRIPVQSGPNDEAWGAFLNAHDLLGILLETGVDHVFRVTYPDGTQRQITFRVVGEFTMENSGFAPAARWSAACRAADPRWYGTTTRSVTFNPSATPTTGLTVPLVTPLDPQSGASGNTVNLLNAGNVYTTPLYTITGPWPNPFILNVTTGISLYTRGITLSGADVLKVDTNRQQILLNDELRQDLADWSTSSGWPYMARGSNAITFGGSYQAGASAVITAQDAWM